MTSRSHAEKLLTGIPKAGRRAQYSSSTRRALIDVAARLFAQYGYAGTSLDAIVSGARVTKGALYHHFSGKQAVYEAVFEKIENDASARIKKALRRPRDPWEKATIGLRTFLDVVQNPSYQRVVIQEGPAVLGYERFREQEERSSFGLVQDLVRTVLSASDYNLSEEMVETFSRIFFGAMSAAGEAIATAEDPAAAVARVEAALNFILTGLRSLADAGVELPDPVTAEPKPEAEAEAPQEKD
ncbi:TetR/AcrR family transcriptional regulator [Nocardioides terrisoli]|uniref:TetR/AcrR family transcriptional regulator n=1 Tax=Nocardioides terrisoli TaxID=3388267 RepID=UPI00287B729B|nr:helix-turn-helix domain-containing protein [Nocardioides marmorisolisilvae]